MRHPHKRHPTVDALITSSHDSQSLGPPMMYISCPWTSDTKYCPSSALYYALLEWHLLSTHRDLLEVENFIDPEHMTLCTQLPIVLWVMEAIPHKLGIATKASLQ